MREQDSRLVGQFLSLQTAIHLVRRNRSCPSLVAISSHSSLSSSSWLSLDDGAFSAPGDTPVHHRDVMFELQQRTQQQLHLRQSSLDGSQQQNSPETIDDFYSRTQSLLNVTSTCDHRHTSLDRRPDFLLPRFNHLPRTCHPLNNNNTYSDSSMLKLADFQEDFMTSPTYSDDVPRLLLTPPCSADDATPINDGFYLPGGEGERVLCSLTDSESSCDENDYDTLTKRPKHSSQQTSDVIKKCSLTSDVFSLDVSTDSLDIPDVTTPRSKDGSGSVFTHASVSSADDVNCSFEDDSLEDDDDHSTGSDDVTLAAINPPNKQTPP